MDTILKFSGVVALVILAIMGLVWLTHRSTSTTTFGTAVDCGSSTCLSGGFGLTTGPFQVDGNSIFNGNVTMTGTPSITGNLALTGNLSVTGTSALTGTTTLGQSLIATENPLCFQYYATSSATPNKLVLVVGSTTATATAGLVGLAYGTCN